MEASAVSQYMKQFPNIRASKCGFRIDVSAPFLGATPDRLTEETGSKGVLEVNARLNTKQRQFNKLAWTKISTWKRHLAA